MTSLSNDKKKKVRELLAKLNPSDEAKLLTKNLEEDIKSLEEKLSNTKDYSETITKITKGIFTLRDFIIDKLKEVPDQSALQEVSKFSSENVDALESKLTTELNNIQSDVLGANSDIEGVKEDMEKEIAELKEIITTLKAQISSIGGGSINQQIRVNGIIATSRYADINIIASGATVVNDNTNKRTDITIPSGSGGVTSLNTLIGDVVLAEGSNITITPSGNTLTFASTGSGSQTPWVSDINGGGFNLSNVVMITATAFIGDGSGLTGIVATGYMLKSVYDPQNAGYISGSNSGGTLKMDGTPSSSGGSINITGGNGGGGGNGGSINTTGGGGIDGGFINTSYGGFINTSRNGGFSSGGYVDTSGWSGGTGAGGLINTSGGANGAGGSIDTHDNGGSISTRGTGSIELGTAGTRTTFTGSASANRSIALPDANGTLGFGDMLKSIYDPQNAGYISGVTIFSGIGGTLKMDGNASNADAGYINTSAGAGVTGDGGYINTSGASTPGGFINTSGGGSLPGGSIDTHDGGGSINTRGVGLLELGVTGTRTSLVGTATADRSISLPDANGTLLLSNGDGSGLTNLSAGNIVGALPAINGSALIGITQTVVNSASGVTPVADGTYSISATLGGSVTFVSGIVTAWTPAA